MSPTSLPSSTARSPRLAPPTPRGSRFLRRVLSSSYITFVSSSPVLLSRCPSYKYTCTHLHPAPAPTSWAFQKLSPSPASPAKVRLKLTASGSSVLSTTPSQPSQPHRGAVGLSVSAQRGHPATPPCHPSSRNWVGRKGRDKTGGGRVWVGPVLLTGLGREGRGGERPQRKRRAPTA